MVTWYHYSKHDKFGTCVCTVDWCDLTNPVFQAERFPRESVYHWKPVTYQECRQTLSTRGNSIEPSITQNNTGWVNDKVNVFYLRMISTIAFCVLFSNFSSLLATSRFRSLENRNNKIISNPVMLSTCMCSHGEATEKMVRPRKRSWDHGKDGEAREKIVRPGKRSWDHGKDSEVTEKIVRSQKKWWGIRKRWWDQGKNE